MQDDFEKRIARTVLFSQGWLSGTPDAFRNRVLAATKIIRIAPGQTIYASGDPSDGMYGIVSGRIKFTFKQGNGSEIVCGIASSGGWFGEVSVFDELPRYQSAIGIDDGMIAFLSSEMYAEIVREDPFNLQHFTTILTTHLRATLYYLNEIATRKPIPRIARLLLLMVSPNTQAIQACMPVIEISQDELARLANLSRQTTNAALRYLAEAGVVELHYGAIIVRDSERLGTIG